MLKKYSIAEARHDLAAIVKELEQQPAIQITRRGQPVAVLVSAREFERLSSRSNWLLGSIHKLSRAG